MEQGRDIIFATELLRWIRQQPEYFLGEVALDLLRRLGYGWKIQPVSKISRTGKDDLTQGFLMKAPLLDFTICVKPWPGNNNPVRLSSVTGFARELQRMGAHAGFFLTRAGFSDAAWEYVKSIDKKIVLIDGKQLANFMIDYRLGVSTTSSYHSGEIAHDYFRS